MQKEHEVAIDHLLSRFLIVETLEDAIRLSKKCESGARLVSLEGEVVLPAGAITGGQGRQKASGLLARKRELDEIESKTAAIERDIEKSSAQIEGAKNEVATSENALKIALEAHNELRNQIARQEREVETATRDLRKNAAQREAVEAQIRLSQANLELKASTLGDADKLDEVDEARAAALELAAEGARAVVV